MHDKDIQFLKWFHNYDFNFIEGMPQEQQLEYYCRAAWFAREGLIDNKKEFGERHEALAEYTDYKKNKNVLCPVCKGNSKLNLLEYEDHWNLFIPEYMEQSDSNNWKLICSLCKGTGFYKNGTEKEE